MWGSLRRYFIRGLLAGLWLAMLTSTASAQTLLATAAEGASSGSLGPGLVWEIVQTLGIPTGVMFMVIFGLLTPGPVYKQVLADNARMQLVFEEKAIPALSQAISLIEKMGEGIGRSNSLYERVERLLNDIERRGRE